MSVVAEARHGKWCSRMTELIESFGSIRAAFIEKAWRLKGVCASTRPNANGRTYPYEVLSRAVADYQSRILEGTSYGELEHPNSARGSAKDSAILITKMGFLNDCEVYMEATVLDSPDGKVIQSMLRAGGCVQFSTRGIGSMNEDGTVQPDYKIFAVDVVLNASNPDAHDVQAFFEDEPLLPVTHAGEPTAGLDANPPAKNKKRRRSPALDVIARRFNANHGTARETAVNTKPTLRGHDKMKGETPASNTVRGHDRSGGYKRYKADPTHGGAVVNEGWEDPFAVPDDVFEDFVSKNAEMFREAWQYYLAEGSGLGTASPPGYGKPAGLHQGEWKKPSKGVTFQKPKFSAPSKGLIGNHPLNEACRHLAECDVAHPMFGHALKLASKLHEASSTPSNYGGQKTTTKPEHDLASYGKSMQMAAGHLKSNPDKGMFGAFKSLGKMVSKAHRDAMKATKESADDDDARLADMRREQKESINFQMQRFDDLNKFNQKG
jgi:hypothetical protein